MYRAAVTHCYWYREYHFFLRLGGETSQDLIQDFRLVYPPEPRTSVISLISVDRNMKVLSVRVTATIRAIARLSFITGPDFFIKYKIRDSFVLFKFFKYNGTVNPFIRVMG
jgi:hypothetical protein